MLVPFAILVPSGFLPYPWNNRPNSLQSASDHTSLYFGSWIKCRYSSARPVSLSMTGLAYLYPWNNNPWFRCCSASIIPIALEYPLLNFVGMLNDACVFMYSTSTHSCRVADKACAMLV